MDFNWSNAVYAFVIPGLFLIAYVIDYVVQKLEDVYNINPVLCTCVIFTLIFGLFLGLLPQ